jgi:hypothetical protein
VVGAVVVAGAVVSMVLPDEPSWIPVAVCFLSTLGAIVFGLAVSRPDAEQPRSVGAGEHVLAEATAQLAAGFPQTAGRLYLTDRRLVLEPNQFYSLGMGRRWEAELSAIAGVEQLGRFEGGTAIGGAGRKLAIRLTEGSLHTLSFGLRCDVDAFRGQLEKQLQSVASRQ